MVRELYLLVDLQLFNTSSIRPLTADYPLFSFTSNGVISSNWILVRRAGTSFSSWHAARDNLNGTDVYGTYDSDPLSTSSFSIAFQNIDFDEFLFASGDMSVSDST